MGGNVICADCGASLEALERMVSDWDTLYPETQHERPAVCCDARVEVLHVYER